MTIKGSVAFISHGGGPLPLLSDPNHQDLVNSIKSIAEDIPKPDAIIVISAHWESDNFEIGSHPNPSLIYDYYGFPDDAYTIQYPAAGHTELATRIQQQLKESASLNPTRGLDHGVFVPLKIMYPDADIPVIPISLKNNLDAQEHIELGKQLKPILNENVLILGSGFTFHNMKGFSAPDNSQNRKFETWLSDTLTDAKSEQVREQALIDWHEAPGAKYCHPREEHLLPLHVCYGAASAPLSKQYHFNLWQIQGSAYLWKSSNI